MVILVKFETNLKMYMEATRLQKYLKSQLFIILMRPLFNGIIINIYMFKIIILYHYSLYEIS